MLKLKITLLGLLIAVLPTAAAAGEIVPTADASAANAAHTAAGSPLAADSLLAAFLLLGLFAGLGIYSFLRAESALIAAHKSR